MSIRFCQLSLVGAILLSLFAVVPAHGREVDYEHFMEIVRKKDVAISELKTAVSSLDDLCGKDTDAKKRVPADIKKLLAGIKEPIQKANLLSVLIGAKNISRDERQLRQWIDELEEIMDEGELPLDCLYECRKAIGVCEFWMGNIMEAEKALCQCLDEAEEKENGSQVVEVLDILEFVYLRKGDRKMFDHIFKKKTAASKRLRSGGKERAEIYGNTATKCALLREWGRFDDACKRSSEADGGKELCQALLPLLLANMHALVEKNIAMDVAREEMNARMWIAQFGEDPQTARKRQLAYDSRYVRNMENNYCVSDFVRMASGGGFSLIEFNKISGKIYDYCTNVNFKAELAEEFGLQFLIELIMHEIKLGRGVPCIELRESLKSLKPAPFSIMQTMFSVDDANALLLQTKLCISQRLGDLPECSMLAQQLESSISDLTKPVALLMADYFKAKIAEVWIEQGKVREGHDLLFPAVEQNLKAQIDDYVATYYNLGHACRLSGAMGDAEFLMAKAYDWLFRRTRPSGYRNDVCFYGADVCTESAIILAAKKAEQDEIDDMIEKAIGLALKGGHPDALGRAYQEAMKNLFMNPDMSRKEKLAKVEKMKGDCLSATSNPSLLASFFYNSAKFEYGNNISAKKIVKEIEQYFHYQQLFAELTDAVSPNSHDSEMREMLLSLLGEMDDAAGLDYWNKVFEKRKTRSAEIASMRGPGDKKANEFMPLLAQVSKYEAASEILKREQAKPEGSRDQTLLAKATEIKRELERNFDEAQKTLSPENAKRLRDLLADSFIIHPDSMGQLCSVLSDDVVCLQFLPVGEKIVVYLAAKGATPFVTTVQLKEKGLTERQLSSKVVKLRSKIQNGAAGKSLDQELKSLYDVLIADVRPVMDRLKCRRVIVNSSGMLRYVPFAALYDGDKYLVERYQISNVTGLDLIRLAKAEPNRSADSVRAMVFADPDGSLPSGRKEGERVAELFKNSQLLVGDKASMANFESMIGNVNFIHLATHAVLDSGNPKNSFILFADGCQWRYCDMMGFCVENVDSIVLSACSTAVGEKSDGGEIEGMAYQLLRKSPSGSVLASFWKVDDEATEKLMGVYYNHISSAMREKGSLDRGGALHEAQLALLHNPDTASPYYWAAFSLFGDFR